MGLSRLSAVIVAFLPGLAMASCQSAADKKPLVAVEPPRVAAAEISDNSPNFEKWLARLREEARDQGISEAAIQAALAGVTPLAPVVELDRRQPEFTQTFNRYVRNAITDRRIADGKDELWRHRQLLKQLAKEYDIPPRFLVAFWGMETHYGRYRGCYSVVDALVTLAFDGRRAMFFRNQLLDALRILDQGHIPLSEMTGSWAGAMGHPQFMPSTFLRYAVDANRDGHKNIWSNIPDALTSAANYLRALGWDGARTWGREVRLPPQFDLIWRVSIPVRRKR